MISLGLMCVTLSRAAAYAARSCRKASQAAINWASGLGAGVEVHGCDTGGPHGDEGILMPVQTGVHGCLFEPHLTRGSVAGQSGLTRPNMVKTQDKGVKKGQAG